MDEPSSVSLWTYRHVHSSVLDKDQVRCTDHLYPTSLRLMPVGASEGDKKNLVTVGFFCTKRRENGGVKSDRTTARAVRAKLAWPMSRIHRRFELESNAAEEDSSRGEQPSSRIGCHNPRRVGSWQPRRGVTSSEESAAELFADLRKSGAIRRLDPRIRRRNACRPEASGYSRDSLTRL